MLYGSIILDCMHYPELILLLHKSAAVQISYWIMTVLLEYLSQLRVLIKIRNLNFQSAHNFNLSDDESYFCFCCHLPRIDRRQSTGERSCSNIVWYWHFLWLVKACVFTQLSRSNALIPQTRAIMMWRTWMSPTLLTHQRKDKTSPSLVVG